MGTALVTACILDRLNLQGPRGQGALDVFLCMRDVHDEVIKLRAVGLYALYRLYNGIRHNHFSPSDFQGAFSRFIKESLH